MSTEPARTACPDWERDWPGRYGWEIRMLQAARVPFRVSDGQLAMGKLLLDLDWPNRGRTIRLRVLYPDGYPRLKPMVYLRGMNGVAPTRHRSPLNNELCLLGRDTRQWDPDWTLSDLLVRQLDAALNDGGEEDPQGEPMEVWWNSRAASLGRSFCLVDSTWAPVRPGPGMLSVRLRLDRGAPTPEVRGCVTRVSATDGHFTAEMDSPVPNLDTLLRVPWVHVAEPLVPRSDVDLFTEVADLIRAHPNLLGIPRQKLTPHHQGRLIAFSYPQEVGHRQHGTGWAFFLFLNRDWVDSGKGAKCWPLQALRAGPTDLVARHPRAGELRGKRVVLFGAGSIGAPLAAELVRNGCSDFHVVEPDVSEPGNSMRWVGGHRAWGMRKGDALKALLAEIDPRCSVTIHTHYIGAPAEGLPVDDGTLVRKLLQGAAIVIDATASFGVIAWLGDVCRRAGVPFLAAMAFPGTDDVAGGAVVLQAPRGACVSCLEHARHRGEVPQPPGDAGEPRLQPPGCAERTFVGTAQDLREVTLQAVRMVPAALSADDVSLVANLVYEESLGVRLPRWRVDAFEVQPGCGCRPAP